MYESVSQSNGARLFHTKDPATDNVRSSLVRVRTAVAALAVAHWRWLVLESTADLQRSFLPSVETTAQNDEAYSYDDYTALTVYGQNCFLCLEHLVASA